MQTRTAFYRLVRQIVVLSFDHHRDRVKQVVDGKCESPPSRWYTEQDGGQGMGHW